MKKAIFLFFITVATMSFISHVEAQTYSIIRYGGVTGTITQKDVTYYKQTSTAKCGLTARVYKPANTRGTLSSICKVYEDYMEIVDGKMIYGDIQGQTYPATLGYYETGTVTVNKNVYFDWAWIGEDHAHFDLTGIFSDSGPIHANAYQLARVTFY